jgi:dTDP-4-amino-4,6-dideoxygalactose transaminase
VYDAAHAFGVNCHCGSVLNHGDLSVLSFHATKVFNTFEGGAIISHTPEMKHRIDRLKNFGFVNEITVDEIGINGKMSEFNAAVGLAQLPHLADAIAKRAQISDRYIRGLAGVKGITCVDFTDVQQHNYAYFPILINAQSKSSREQVYDKLKTEGVHARRYFYPLLTDFPMYAQGNPSSALPVAYGVAKQVLCLPIYPDLSEAEVDQVVSLMRGMV